MFELLKYLSIVSGSVNHTNRHILTIPYLIVQQLKYNAGHIAWLSTVLEDFQMCSQTCIVYKGIKKMFVCHKTEMTKIKNINTSLYAHPTNLNRCLSE